MLYYSLNPRQSAALMAIEDAFHDLSCDESLDLLGGNVGYDVSAMDRIRACMEMFTKEWNAIIPLQCEEDVELEEEEEE